MNVPPSISELAGFTLAHALWNVCDIEEGETLCPLAFAETGKQRQLFRYEADSQEEAIERAYGHLSQEASLRAWAFAREGTIRLSSGPSDVVLVDAWTVGMDSPVTFVQPYQPLSSGAFELLCAPLLVVEGAAQSGDDAEAVISAVRTGALSHEKAAEFWESWNGW